MGFPIEAPYRVLPTMSREFSGNSTFFRTGSHIAEEHSPITPEWYWVLAHRLPRPRLLEKYIFVAQKKIQFPWTHGFDSCYPKKATLGGEQNVKVHRDLGIPIVFYNNLQQFATACGKSLGRETENPGRSEKCHENHKISNLVCKQFQ